jgi:flagellar motor switch protein FliG
MSNAAQSLKGPDKAALLLVALGEELGAEVLKHLAETDLKKLAERADQLEPRAFHALDPTFEDFARLMNAPVPVASPGAYFRTITQRALGPEKSAQVFSKEKREKKEGRGPLDALQTARPAILGQLLAEEHPQVAAVILSQLPSELAVTVMKTMPEDRQSNLLARLAGLSEIPRQIADVASKALAEMLQSAGGLDLDEERARFDGVSFAARMLNELPREKTDEILRELDEHHEAVGAKVRQAMFTFEDLLRVGTRGIQVLMKDVSAEQVLAALKTASEALREHFLSAVSSRAAATMREDMAILPPMRLSDVEQAQREIVESALRLAEDGRITLPGRGSEKLV